MQLVSINGYFLASINFDMGQLSVLFVHRSIAYHGDKDLCLRVGSTHLYLDCSPCLSKPFQADSLCLMVQFIITS